MCLMTSLSMSLFLFSSSFFFMSGSHILRGRGHIQAHGFVSGTLERWQVLYDQLSAGSSWHPPATLHRFIQIKHDC